MDERERLLAALRNAHAAGDTVAARRLAGMLAAMEPAVETTPAQQKILEMQARLGPAPNVPIPAPTAPPPSARELGRRSATESGGRAAAAVQGFGSGMFGVGTPATAAGEFVASRLDPDREDLSPGESLEYARGRREGLEEEHPREFYAGMGSSLVGGAGAVRAVAKAAPRAATVFTPQANQTRKNVARLAAAGAAAASVTAANEQGIEAVPAAAAFGAGAGPIVAGAAGAVGAVRRGAMSRINPDNAAIQLLARRLGEPVDALVARFNDFKETMGRNPRLVEIMGRETAEEMGQIGRVRSEAGQVFREAQEESAVNLPLEMGPLTRAGGRVSSEPAQRALLPAAEDVAAGLTGARPTEAAAKAGLASTVEAAEDVVGSRVRSSETAQIGRRDVQFDRLMSTVGGHRVPISDPMLRQIQEPEVWNSLDPAVRRRITRIVEWAEENGSQPAVRVRMWDAIRQELGKKAAAKPEVEIYSSLRNRIRDYVSAAVPEYGAGLKEFGRRTDTARGVTAGRAALTKDAREFADAVRTAGGGTAGTARRPGTRLAEQAGMRVGARTALANALSGPPEAAERMMKRLATDRRLQANLKAVLSEGELQSLTDLGRRFGHQLDFAGGVKAGRQLVARGDTEALANALRGSTPAAAAGVRGGVRSALADALEGSPEDATKLLERLATDPTYRTRVAEALAPHEAKMLERLGARYGRRLEISAGIRTGRDVVKQGDTEAFRDAVKEAGAKPTTAAGVRTGARTAVSEAAGESPAGAATTARRLAEDPGLTQRLEAALGPAETANLVKVGKTALTASRRIGSTVPEGTQAQTRAAEAARAVQEAIQGVVISTNRYSGAFLANFANHIVQRVKLSKKAATRLAKMATDPEQAEAVIARLRSAGVSVEDIHRMYREAATAAGIAVGVEK